MFVKINKSTTHSSEILCEENYKDGALSSAGEWRLNDIGGKPIKTTRHK